MWSTGIDVVLRLSCSAACGIFPDQELNPSPALAGGFFFFFFFTTEPKGKPQAMSFYCSRAQARPPHRTTASSCQVSRVPSDMPLLVFHDLDTLEDRVLARLFAKMSLYLDCVVFFS